MAQDRNGKELVVGDVVACKFRITNMVADSDKMNLLVKHYDGHEGIPDDWRLQLDSAVVLRISEDRPPVNPKPPAQTLEQLPAAEDEEIPEGAHRGKRK